MTANPDFPFFEDLLRREIGLVLTPDKAHLLELRLLPIVYKNGFGNTSDIAQRLRQANDPRLLQEVVEAMAAGETFFFRDPAPYAYLADEALPALLAPRPDDKPLRIWCAACATGQEAYSIAMLLQEHEAPGRGRAEILATDISTEALAYAAAGIYTQFEVQRGLSARRTVKYFTKQDNDWLLNRDIVERVKFWRGNLLTAADYPRACDVIFCRNILLQFDAPMRDAVVGRLKAALNPGGFLFLGADEAAPSVPGFEAIPGVAGIFKSC